MRDMILIVEKGFDLKEIVSKFNESEELRLVVDANLMSIEELRTKDFIQIEKVDEVSEYYDDDEGDVFAGDIPNPEFYVIRFRNIEFLKSILIRFADRTDVYLDNDFGLILRGDEFAHFVKNRPQWDWAEDLSCSNDQ